MKVVREQGLIGVQDMREVDPRICSVNIIYSFIVHIHPLYDTTVPDFREM